MTAEALARLPLELAAPVLLAALAWALLRRGGPGLAGPPPRVGPRIAKACAAAGLLLQAAALVALARGAHGTSIALAAAAGLLLVPQALEERPSAPRMGLQVVLLAFVVAFLPVLRAPAYHGYGDFLYHRALVEVIVGTGHVPEQFAGVYEDLPGYQLAVAQLSLAAGLRPEHALLWAGMAAYLAVLAFVHRFALRLVGAAGAWIALVLFVHSRMSIVWSAFLSTTLFASGLMFALLLVPLAQDGWARARARAVAACAIVLAIALVVTHTLTPLVYLGFAALALASYALYERRRPLLVGALIAVPLVALAAYWSTRLGGYVRYYGLLLARGLDARGAGGSAGPAPGPLEALLSRLDVTLFLLLFLLGVVWAARAWRGRPWLVVLALGGSLAFWGGLAVNTLSVPLLDQFVLGRLVYYALPFAAALGAAGLLLALARWRAVAPLALLLVGVLLFAGVANADFNDPLLRRDRSGIATTAFTAADVAAVEFALGAGAPVLSDKYAAALVERGYGGNGTALSRALAPAPEPGTLLLVRWHENDERMLPLATGKGRMAQADVARLHHLYDAGDVSLYASPGR